MTQENKKLLLTDLCARLPYGVKVQDELGRVNKLVIGNADLIRLFYNDFSIYGENALSLPLLRPMSSMTEEEREDFWWNVLDMDWKENLDYDELETVPFPFVENGCGFYLDNYYLRDTFAVIDWLNAHHFDFRGLIEKGLAIEVTKENNPYET